MRPSRPNAGWRLTSTGIVRTVPVMVATDRFEMRVDPGDRARWEEAARRDGRTLSRWLAVLANREVERLAEASKAKKANRRERGIRALK